MKKPKQTPDSAAQAAKPVPAPPPAAPDRLPWWVAPVLLCLALIAYLPALRGPFLFDDLGLPILSGAQNQAWTAYVVRGARAVFNLSLLLDYNLWGLNPAPFHILNWLLHCANGLLVFFILRKLIDMARNTLREPVQANILAAFGAALFLLHPIQTEAVSYIASRSEVLSVFFSFAAYALFLYRSEVSIELSRALAIVALILLGIASKETAVAMVPVFLLTDYVFNPGFSFRGIFGNWRLYLPMIAGGAAGGLYIYQKVSREGTAGAGLPFGPFDYLVTQFKVVFIYLRLVVFPWGQNLDHGFPITKTPGDLLAWLGLLSLLALTVAAWIFRKQLPLVFLGWTSYLVLLAPTSSILPIMDPLVERRVYLPSLGLLLMGCGLLGRLDATRIRNAAMCAVVLVLAFVTMNRNQVYASSQAMWEDSIAGNPNNYRAHFQLAYAFYAQGQCAESVKHYARAAELSKPDYRMLVDWALALECAGNADEAVAKLKQAIKMERNSHAWAVLGMVYGKRNLAVQALEALNQALLINPGDANALVYRGNVYVVSGQPASAIKDFDLALQIDPTNQAAQQGKAAAQRALPGAR